MGHYVTEVEQRTTEFYSKEIPDNDAPMLWYLIQLKCTAQALKRNLDSRLAWKKHFNFCILIQRPLQHFSALPETQGAILQRKLEWDQEWRISKAENYIQTKSSSCVSLQRHYCKLIFKVILHFGGITFSVQERSNFDTTWHSNFVPCVGDKNRA